MAQSFQSLPLSGWKATRDTVAEYTRLARTIRRENTPPQKHFWHVSLHPTATGLTTSYMRTTGGEIFALAFDLTQHAVSLQTSSGRLHTVPLHGQSIRAFRDEVDEGLDALGITVDYNRDLYTDDAPGVYDQTSVFSFWQNLIEIASVLRQFRSGFRQETSPVQFWPHHFDLATAWYSGRLIPGEDPANAESADEMMNFGFSTGDETIPDPYFYATAYPAPDGWMDDELPRGAYWQTEGWSGAVLPFSELVGIENGRQRLLDFLYAAHRAGASRMKSES